MSVETLAWPPYSWRTKSSWRAKSFWHAKGRENDVTANRYWIGLSVLWLLAWSFSAQAQAVKYPEKPVTGISDAPPGSMPDVDARFIADGLSKVWAQQAVIINHAGANGSIAARAAAEATPDGYTLFMRRSRLSLP
jgi:tripartite-type tricarboxylate transporter receptor subunit TctC